MTAKRGALASAMTRGKKTIKRAVRQAIHGAAIHDAIPAMRPATNEEIAYGLLRSLLVAINHASASALAALALVSAGDAAAAVDLLTAARKTLAPTDRPPSVNVGGAAANGDTRPNVLNRSTR